MERRPEQLTKHEFDLLVIGGGAFGAAAARDAALRGLRTALIERHDFGAGASAECFKMVHGGIRYLQHGDIPRLRSSCRERTALLRIAPHLVQPLPIVIPTYGRGRRGKFFLGAGMLAYDLLTSNRNAGIEDPARRISKSRFLSRAEVLELFPDIEARGLTGAAVFEDGQMYNPARLVLAFVKSAVSSGAVVCNYAEAVDFLWQGSSVRGARVREHIYGTEFDVRARLVLNAAGPWAERLLERSSRLTPARRSSYSRDAFVTLARAPASKYALALQAQTRDRDALFSRSARHLFLVPWRDFTLLGVWHRVFPDHPDTARVTEEEMQNWVAELNAAYPALALSDSDISYANCGLVPFGEQTSGSDELSFGKESRLIDHRKTDGINGLVTIVGIRFTTARGDAARALDLLLRQHPSPPARAATERIALAGGTIDNFERFRHEAQRMHGTTIPPRSLEALLRNHGRDYRAVLAQTLLSYSSSSLIPGTDTLWAEVVHAVREESAVTLEDVVLRRTDLGTGRHPGRDALEKVADCMARLLGWPARRRKEEIQNCENALRAHAATAPAPAGNNGNRVSAVG